MWNVRFSTTTWWWAIDVFQIGAETSYITTPVSQDTATYMLNMYVLNISIIFIISYVLNVNSLIYDDNHRNFLCGSAILIGLNWLLSVSLDWVISAASMHRETPRHLSPLSFKQKIRSHKFYLAFAKVLQYFWTNTHRVKYILTTERSVAYRDCLL